MFTGRIREFPTLFKFHAYSFFFFFFYKRLFLTTAKLAGGLPDLATRILLFLLPSLYNHV